MTEDSEIKVNPPTVTVGFRPRATKFVSERIGSLTIPETGETVWVNRVADDPFTYLLFGTKLIGVVDMRAMFSEAIQHVDARNAK